MSTVHHPVVAGSFYPEDPAELRAMVRRLLAGALPRPSRALREPQDGASGNAAPGRSLEALERNRGAVSSGEAPKAMIAPHAGYVYSGPVAASGYALLAQRQDQIRRVVLVGPSHFFPFRGLALSGARTFATPLGQVSVDGEAADALLALPSVQVLDAAYDHEHSLEVHLPFLQEVLGDFTLIPLLAGDAAPAEVASVLEAVWGGDETAVVITSDLSHYHDPETARRLDAATAAAIEALRPEEIRQGSACGAVPVRGLLWLGRQRRLRARTVDLRNSGDTAGPSNAVVGYGTFVFAESHGGAATG